MFISVGPSAFTAIGLVSMGEALEKSHAFGQTFAGIDGRFAEAILRVMSIWFGVWLWGLAFWFCIVTIGAHISYIIMEERVMKFKLNWWSFIFPNCELFFPSLCFYTITQYISIVRNFVVQISYLCCWNMFSICTDKGVLTPLRRSSSRHLLTFRCLQLTSYASRWHDQTYMPIHSMVLCLLPDDMRNSAKGDCV